MRNENCTICGKPFPARAGKLFCSPACKQIAYNERIKSLQKLKEESKASSHINPAMRYIFNLSEWDIVLEQLPNITFAEYYFFRRNIFTAFSDTTIKLINELRATVEIVNDTRVGDILTSTFEQFLAQLHDGTIQFVETSFDHVPESYPIPVKLLYPETDLLRSQTDEEVETNENDTDTEIVE